MSSQIPDVAGFDSPSKRRPGELLGHPTCLFTLFFTEMWERFSFYGMKALLIFYMVNYLYWSQKEASTVMMWYASLVYVTPVIGGILADKLLGARWSVFLGGILIAIGHFLLAFEPLPFFYSGLGFLIGGVGLLKPNVSTQVGALYRTDDERRDSAFTIFYMGINLGAFIGPLICGWLADNPNYGYHWGFGAAGVGMVLGLIVYVLGMGSVERRSRQIAAEEAAPEAEKSQETEQPTQGPVKEVPSHVYRDRSIVLVVICVFCILFWIGFEQAANVMNLWAEKHSNLHVFQATTPEVVIETQTAETAGTPGGLSEWSMPAAWSQSINPLYIIALAPVFAVLWTFLEKRRKQPSTPMKMAMGVFFATLAYGAILAAGASENKPTSAALSALPAGLQPDEAGRLYTLEEQHDGKEKRVFYGATRLRYDSGALHMSGVLTDLDWMHGLGMSSPEAYQQAVEDLTERAEERAEEVRLAKKAGQMAKDATWDVQVTLPPEVVDITPIAGWPTEENGEEQVQKVFWDPGTRTLTTTGILSVRDQAQVLANGAEPQFCEALTSIYRQSSLLRVSIGWLLLFYLLLTIGELCLSPVGLSLVTKAAPPKYVGLFMGLWFLTTGGAANWLAHFAGGYWGTMTPTAYFLIFGIVAAGATVIMLLLMRVLKPMLHGVH